MVNLPVVLLEGSSAAAQSSPAQTLAGFKPDVNHL
jgi:hypothetical protein